MRILIIEDSALFAEILETFLVSKQCETKVSSNLQAAKDQLMSSSFEFILLDNQLPDGNGIDILPFIKSLSCKVPVMMITAEDNQALMSVAFEKGVDDFLVKPISVELLWQKIQRCRNLYDQSAVVSLQTQELENLLNQRKQEENLARYVYEYTTASLATNTQYVDTYIQSLSSFNGDAFICNTAPNGNLFVILADATGHGLAAAIIILPLASTIKAMIKKNLSLASIIHEANKKLNIELPDNKFVAIIGIEINFNKRELQLFNGGMPDVILLKTDHSLARYSSTSMALGILEPAIFDPKIMVVDMGTISNLFFFSDGLIEQHPPQGKAFGMHHLIEILERYDFKESLVSYVVNEFTVFNDMAELLDDLSICDLQIQSLIDSHVYNKPKFIEANHGRITLTLEIEGGLIASTDVVGYLDGMMRSVDIVGDLRQRAFTVFAELINNGIDHGILNLDSKLKNDFSGFSEYLRLKEARLIEVGSDDKISMKFTFCPNTAQIDFEIIDSGQGFDMNKDKNISLDGLSGRGLDLVKNLCETVDIVAPGNKIIVNLKSDR
ncbi:MAG: DNA-binding response OmpR family regulator [Pseudohongiellaceae bacterium]|jgi:DNA-binding response OmpR family regulator